MPREHCQVCNEWRTLTDDDIDRNNHFCCPECGTRLAKAYKTRYGRA